MRILIGVIAMVGIGLGCGSTVDSQGTETEAITGLPVFEFDLANAEAKGRNCESLLGRWDAALRTNWTSSLKTAWALGRDMKIQEENNVREVCQKKVAGITQQFQLEDDIQQCFGEKGSFVSVQVWDEKRQTYRTAYSTKQEDKNERFASIKLLDQRNRAHYLAQASRINWKSTEDFLYRCYPENTEHDRPHPLVPSWIESDY